MLTGAWVALIFSSLCLLAGLYSRFAAVLTWLLHLSATKSGALVSYGADNFVTIALFYLVISPLPDRFALDCRFGTASTKDPRIIGFCRRALQLHLCLIYLFSGIAKALGSGWWNGSNLWRALTRPPFNLLSAETLIVWKSVFPVAGICVVLLEIGYAVFIWHRRFGKVWLACVCTMHALIALTMGMYLFALIMIVLNVAAFGFRSSGLPNEYATTVANDI
jgi:hypothetical protein